MKKKLSILIYSLAGGGAERVVSILLHELQDRFDVTLFLMNGTMVYDIPKNQKIVYLEKSDPFENGIIKLLKLPFLGWKYKKLCEENSIDISVSFMNRPVYVAMFAKIFGLKIKNIISERSTPSQIYAKNNFQSKVSKYLIKWLYPKSDLIVSNSKGNGEDLVENFSIDAHKIKTIYNTFDLEMIQSASKENGVKVVLSADEGDEIFCGYERYWVTHALGKKMFSVPSVAKKALSSLMEGIGAQKASKFFTIKNFEHKYHRLTEMLKEPSWKGLYETMAHNSKNYEIEELLGKLHPIDEKSFIIGEREHPMQGMMLWDYHRYMVDDILTKVDRATMSVSIEGREPLLDHRIAEFMARVPFDLKYKEGKSKYLLRKVLEKYIPKELIERPKMGFGIPLFEWFSDDLKGLFEVYFEEETIKKQGVINSDYLKKEYEKFKNSKIVNINKLWLILVFEMWYEKYRTASE